MTSGRSLPSPPAALFAYGTLRFPDVLTALLGRVPEQAPAAVDGWRVAALDGRDAHFSRLRIAASSPIPPTTVTRRGASRGGPISRLYRALRQPPGFWATPRACR